MWSIEKMEAVSRKVSSGSSHCSNISWTLLESHRHLNVFRESPRRVAKQPSPQEIECLWEQFAFLHGELVP